jgi:hypothetical protein
VVYAKPPFAGAQAVLAYLSRYTHRIAISNRWFVAYYAMLRRPYDYRRNLQDLKEARSMRCSSQHVRNGMLHPIEFERPKF